MYYVAHAVLETADKVYEPGDAIPEFSTWDNMVQRAHLNQGTVERIHGTRDESVPTGRLKAKPAPPKDDEEAASPDDPAEGGTGDRAPADAGDGEDGDPYEAHRNGDIYSCPACEGSVFTAVSGLKRHVTRVHQGHLPQRQRKPPDDARFAKAAPPPSPDAKHVNGLMSEFGAQASAEAGDD